MTPNSWTTGPVAITGADGHVGGRLQRRLAELPNPIRPLTGTDDWPAGMRGAEAVIHLAGTLQPKPPNTYVKANIGTVERCLEALHDSQVRRIVFLSYVGADPSSANAYLRTKGEAEELIQATGIPAVIFRSSFVYGNLDDIGPSFASYQTETDGTVSLLGGGTQQMAPIQVDDLAELLIAAALDPTAPTGTFEVSGPEIFTLNEFVRLINPDGVRIRHISSTVARLLARILPSLTPALVEVLLADSLPAGDPTDTASRFGVSLHHLGEGMSTRSKAG